ncbi:MAG: hypothetical protein HY534_00835 [Chloroflexi bacterium]|nr:hypothetical protein [Chloroflexota bacterium]
MTRRYGAGIRGYRLGLTSETIAALDAVVPAGQRAAFCEAAIRKALAERARLLGAGDLPGERLEVVAEALEQMSAEVRRHAKLWGDDANRGCTTYWLRLQSYGTP